MAWTKISTGVQPQLNDQETTTLQSHVEDWRKASGMEQQDIFKAAAREAKILAPKIDKELLKQCKESCCITVTLHRNTESGSRITGNPIPKHPPSCQKKRTAHQVIKEERKATFFSKYMKKLRKRLGRSLPKGSTEEVSADHEAIMQWLDKKELQEDKAKAESGRIRRPMLLSRPRQPGRGVKKW
ncbi:hypothetical protein BDR07DRAFT_1382452 [Suillus spraguei]|nr:hypothetical protein BDR07DRAFT_1382452 [Suillus spraguei]